MRRTAPSPLGGGEVILSGDLNIDDVNEFARTRSQRRLAMRGYDFVDLQ
jgi:hypothetical protein